MPDARPSTVLRFVVAALLAAALAGAPPARAGHYSDLWWNPAEPGWGVNLVHQEDIVFATLFVYDHAGRPMWLVAPETREIGLGADGRSYHTGPLFATTGPVHTGPFDPASVGARQVGELHVSPIAEGRIRLEYAFDGIVVAKDLQRQTFRDHDIAATYLGSFALRRSVPGEPLEARQFGADTRVYITAGRANLFLQIGPVSCHYAGPYRQQGRLGAFEGTFTCNSGEDGTFEVSDFEVNAHAISGRLVAKGAFGTDYGRFAGPRV